MKAASIRVDLKTTTILCIRTRQSHRRTENRNRPHHALQTMSSNHKLKQFFTGRGLPWTTSIENALKEYGYDSREIIKFMNRSECLALFSDKNAAKQRLAKHVFEELQKEEFDPTKYATDIPFLSPPPNNTTSGANISNQREKESNDIKNLKLFDFTHSTIKNSSLTENANHCHPPS